MKEEIQNLIKKLKESLNLNLSQIRDDEVRIKHLLEEPPSKIRSYELSKLFNRIKELQEYNHDLMNTEMKLKNFLFKNYHTIQSQRSNSHHRLEENLSDLNSLPVNYNTSREEPEVDHPADAGYQELLEQTISGNITYSVSHPMYGDEKFFIDLFQRSIELEKYELCSFLNSLNRHKVNSPK